MPSPALFLSSLLANLQSPEEPCSRGRFTPATVLLQLLLLLRYLAARASAEALAALKLASCAAHTAGRSRCRASANSRHRFLQRSSDTPDTCWGLYFKKCITVPRFALDTKFCVRAIVSFSKFSAMCHQPEGTNSTEPAGAVNSRGTLPQVWGSSPRAVAAAQALCFTSKCCE